MSEDTQTLERLVFSGLGEYRGDFDLVPAWKRAEYAAAAKAVIAHHEATHPSLKPGEVCIWTEQRDRNEDPFWSTSCGTEIALLSGTPEENEYRFCSCCGRPLQSTPSA